MFLRKKGMGCMRTTLLTAGLAGIMSFIAFGAEAPFYSDKSDLVHYLDVTGERQAITSAADWAVRRNHIVENMQRVMGRMPGPDHLVSSDMDLIEEVDCGAYVRRKITFAVESWDRLPAYLLVPKKIDGRRPAVLCLHPTNPWGKGVVVGLSEEPNRNYASELAERGFVTLAPDYPGFGDYVPARKALYAQGYSSCTMKGIWNHMRSIDLLCALPYVDKDRIGCIGHSLGGHNTLFLSVFDDRVKVAVTSCGFTAFAKYMSGDLTGWTHDGYMPAIASEFGKDPARMPFDFTEVLAAIAPRAVFVNAPLHDANFDVDGVRECVRAAAPVFAILHAQAPVEAIYPDAQHDFPPEARAQAYRFIESVLGTPETH